MGAQQDQLGSERSMQPLQRIRARTSVDAQLSRGVAIALTMSLPVWGALLYLAFG